MLRYIKYLAVFIVFGCANAVGDESVVLLEEAPVDQNVYGINLNEFYAIEGEIKKGDFFGTLLLNLGASGSSSQKLIEASKGVFDVTKIIIGNAYEAFYTNKGDSLVYFIYEIDKTSNVLFSLRDSVFVKIFKKEIVPQIKFAEVTINSSLWNDVKKAGCSNQLALKLSDIYDCTIDFFGLQKGDSFRVIYEDLIHDGNFVGLSHVYYVEFVHDKKVFKAIRFDDGETGSKYWNEMGESLKKAFLKAPLNFTRISSGFTYARKHPVLKIVRPHTGVDYAAPSGTPVVSIGDGVVVSKGWAGGGGNTVKIKHNSTYTTSYMHLKGYAKGLKTGQRIKQGECIGYVGSTGVSTGPHLDFRVYKNGKPINPLTMDSPSVEPVAKKYIAAFNETHNSYLSKIDSLDAINHFNNMLDILR